MLFNSIQFLIFFIIVYGLYLILSHRWQNRMLLVASCIFYGAWDIRFLALMFLSISTDFFCGLKIHNAPTTKEKKIFLFIAIFVNLAILIFFKYFNFFADNFTALLSHMNIHSNPMLLKIILPVGISFYTFQAMSYAFDVYRQEIPPARNYWDYALFVTYFPHLVAGPIMKAKNLLPQVINPRVVTLDKLYEGCYWILWGLYQKIFIADNLAKLVDPVFASAPENGIIVLLTTYAFAFQIYCDFAGYSNIAKGLGKCMGFDILTNFNLPYFSANPVEFWKRWHISLSTWLRDYLYIPLGGKKVGSWLTYRNLAITMLIGGLWHGAAWTFLLWGAYHGALLISHRLWRSMQTQSTKTTVPQPNNLFTLLKIICFFHFTCLGWLVFRATSIHQISHLLKTMVFNFHGIHSAAVISMASKLVVLTGFLLFIEVIQYYKNDLTFILKIPRLWRVAFYYMCALSLIFGGANVAKQFIYFQF